jgi:hypothetical protein
VISDREQPVTVDHPRIGRLRLDFVVKQMRGLSYQVEMKGIHFVVVQGYGRMRVDDFRAWAERQKEIHVLEATEVGFTIPAYPTSEDFE